MSVFIYRPVTDAALAQKEPGTQSGRPFPPGQQTAVLFGKLGNSHSYVVLCGRERAKVLVHICSPELRPDTAGHCVSPSHPELFESQFYQ